MAKARYPVTSAVRALRAAKLDYEPFLYDYEDKGGTRASARALDVDEHQVIKTLVMETHERRPLIVLMHGDREVSTKSLARQLDVKAVAPCAPKVAEKHSGYRVGGTSPFGTRSGLPVYAQRSIADLDVMYINAGKRGFLVRVAPKPALSALRAQLVHAEA